MKKRTSFVCRRTDGRIGKCSNRSLGGRWFSDASMQHSFWVTQHEVARITFWITAVKCHDRMETIMIDGNVLFLLELCALAVLVGVGVWRIYRTRHSATIIASVPVAYDMRQDGQRLSVQTDPQT